ncbi:DUF5686 family protein [Shivajiella indica]|uniref:DUF5686 family protein n=1 Tax=Shivajiella indica TaxID=872115 RepID=A0ABW5BBD1_9BACT
MKYYLAVLFLFTGALKFSFLSAQNLSIEGYILDQNTSKPVPFANIQLIGNNQKKGAITDVRGWYRLFPSPEDSLVIISHVSYEKRTIPLIELKVNADIFLNPSTLVLGEYVLEAGENPALALIKKAIEKKPINDPRKLDSYKFEAYHKTVLSFEGLNEFPDYDDPNLNYLEGGHLFMAESFSEVKFKKPGKINEIVKASKISGIDNPLVALAASTFQPFSFYENHFNILETPYLNPLSKDGLSKYNYYLEDSIQQEAYTTYIISYQPKKGKFFQLLKGLLYISGKQFALENMTLTPADSTLALTFEMQQKNSWNGNFWFPEQINANFRTTDNSFEQKNLLIKNQMFINNIEINTLPNNEKFNPVSLVMDINNRNFEWEKLRLDSLTYREYQTYRRFENMPEKEKRQLNLLSKFIGQLATGRIPLGPVDLIPERLFRINRYEGFALGLGLSSNQTLSDFFRIEGYFRYGFRDKALKYGGGIEFMIDKKYDTRLKLNFSQDLIETGSSEIPRLKGYSLSGDAFRRFAAERMDSVQRFSAEISQMPFKGTRIGLFSNLDNRISVLNYTLDDPADNYPSSFRNTEIGLNFRWTGNENISRIGNNLISLSTTYPIVALRIAKALPGILDSSLDFINTELRFFHQWNKGNSTNRFSMAMQGIWGENLPLSYIHSGYGINLQRRNELDFAFYFPSYLQTMFVYEFFSDRSALFSYSHQTGPIFNTYFGKLNFSPQLRFIQNFAIGTLSNPESYSFVAFKTMEKGYWESGLEMNNLFKVSSGFQKRSFGLGAFYRYGPYGNPQWEDNFVITISTNLSF